LISCHVVCFQKLQFHLHVPERELPLVEGNIPKEEIAQLDETILEIVVRQLDLQVLAQPGRELSDHGQQQIDRVGIVVAQIFKRIDKDWEKAGLSLFGLAMKKDVLQMLEFRRFAAPDMTAKKKTAVLIAAKPDLLQNGFDNAAFRSPDRIHIEVLIYGSRFERFERVEDARMIVFQPDFEVI